MTTKQINIIAFVSLVFFSSISFADFKSARKAYLSGDSSGLKELIQLAESGDTNVQCELGFLLRFTRNLQPKEAAKWVKVAFDSGKADLKCQAQWADFLVNGWGEVQKDATTAAKIYERTASLGNVNSEIDLGELYLSGNGVLENQDKGFSLIKSAAEKGARPAFGRLAELYMARNDNAQALVWYKKATESFPQPTHLYWLAVIYEFGWLENGKLTTDAVKAAETYKLAMNEVPYEEYPIFAPYRLAKLYESGRLGTPDEKQIFSLYKIGAEKDLTYAMSDLANCYRDGKGTEKNEVQSIFWSRKAAELNNPEGQAQLGLAYYYGGFGGINKDYVESAKWFEKAATSTTVYGPNSYAMYMIGTMYEDGIGVSRDYTTAADWYKKAAESNQPDAQNKLGAKFAEGNGVKKDMVEALKWFTIATANGNEKARDNRDKAEKVLNKQDVKKAQSLASDWLKKIKSNS